ncbi:P-loop containing nucleoside triphosphate hydrolase [Pseudocohnilembus persalinus]|uniref:p-loop containing nucleoside triphosphate hydrolase n=1 Tax=Pseudocohnilembus persalinus TaxID=266149 RepID=A0A0V0Q776_PSEPJ|nr:P-loop containing nucleoside triphosphate hydrolase [Pseudocohnilembus persalinus]|eukprot:KRW98089.1 P-loop containing nucleoside triphosphate hydrolase [Pseudocohnilembus persalinus]
MNNQFKRPWMNTVKNSDEIIVIDSGKVVERGTHDFLVALGGKYAALSKNQQKAEQEEEENRQHLEKDGIQVDDNDSLENAPQIKNNSSVHWNKSALHKKPKAYNASMVASKLRMAPYGNWNHSQFSCRVSSPYKWFFFGQIIVNFIYLWYRCL